MELTAGVVKRRVFSCHAERRQEESVHFAAVFAAFAAHFAAAAHFQFAHFQFASKSKSKSKFKFQVQVHCQLACKTAKKGKNKFYCWVG